MSRVHSIEELKQKCAEKHMPLEQMRFFIDENRQEPKCFGVYYDDTTGNWIVYKNKADGTRAVRYEGPDEGRAAQEIWDKIGEEVKQRKDKYASPYDETAFRSLNGTEELRQSSNGNVFGMFRNTFSFGIFDGGGNCICSNLYQERGSCIAYYCAQCNRHYEQDFYRRKIDSRLCNCIVRGNADRRGCVCVLSAARI